MKKTYNKPELFFEEFQLSESIAGNCTWAQNNGSLPVDGINYNTPQSCSYRYGGDLLFTSAPVCTEQFIDGENPMLGFCYQAPDSKNIIFNS